MMRFAPTGRSLMLIMVALLLANALGLAEPKGPLTPSKKDKCPVCGMFVYKYPDWTAQIIFKDGEAVFFDGCKDLFKYYFGLKKYSPNRKLEDIAALYVSDYYEMKPIRAMDAYFVVGSEVYGPMGHELIPLATKKDAETFRTDHKGKDILTFHEVTQKVVNNLD